MACLLLGFGPFNLPSEGHKSVNQTVRMLASSIRAIRTAEISNTASLKPRQGSRCFVAHGFVKIGAIKDCLVGNSVTETHFLQHNCGFSQVTSTPATGTLQQQLRATSDCSQYAVVTET